MPILIGITSIGGFVIYSISYMSVVELIQVLPDRDTIPHTPSRLKLSTDYDVFLIYNISGKLVAVLSDDSEFANSVRYLRYKHQILQNLFTPSIRCVTIHYKDFLQDISFCELLKRYSTQI